MRIRKRNTRPTPFKRLEAFNAAKEIAEVEREKNRQNATVSEMVPTIPPQP
jgi:hypothetical protein